MKGCFEGLGNDSPAKMVGGVPVDFAGGAPADPGLEFQLDPADQADMQGGPQDRRGMIEKMLPWVIIGTFVLTLISFLKG